MAQKMVEHVVASVTNSTHMSIYYTNIFELLDQGWDVKEIAQIIKRSSDYHNFTNGIL